jgi:predicted nucleotidyltransferase
MSQKILTRAEIEELSKPPTDAEVEGALRRFAADARRHYGDRLKGLYLFGSRARGDHSPDSDADVAVVLADNGWEFWKEKRTLIHLAYDQMIETGSYIQPWPFEESVWRGGRDGRFAKVAANARRDARGLV